MRAVSLGKGIDGSRTMAAVATVGRVDHGHGATWIGDGQVVVGHRAEQVEPEQQVG